MRTAIAVLLACAAPAAAQVSNTDVSGFVTYGPGDLAGSVTDPSGKPLAGVKVIVASGTSKQAVMTDAKGNYRVRIGREDAAYVYVEFKAKIIGQMATAVKEGDAEAIAIRETLPPVVQPRAKIGLDVIPEYSDKAIDKNQWARAWLLLEIDEGGKVRRVKLLNAPGLDLDAIAIREAFKIPFEPARDRTNHAVSALVLWTWEWPEHYWMLQNRRYPNRIPAQVATLACKGTGPSKAIRDCSKPSVEKAVTLPWIERAP